MGYSLAIALGGAGGALLRYWTTVTVQEAAGRDFPYATLLVNVVGSALLGFLHGWVQQGAPMSEELRLALAVGVLGALTTFSTFSLETVTLLQAGRFGAALLNAGASVALCVASCWLGLALARSVLSSS